MVYMTVEIPDQLAERIRPVGAWLPTVLDLSIPGFRTPAAETATELVEFLSTDPSAQQVFDYHVSERAQTRLQRLLALNEAGLLGEAEQRELDELGRIEHVVVLLKAQAAAQKPSVP